MDGEEDQSALTKLPAGLHRLLIVSHPTKAIICTASLELMDCGIAVLPHCATVHLYLASVRKFGLVNSYS